MRWFSTLSAVFVVVPTLVACVEPDPGTEAVAFMPCPKWGCGENSPIMGPFGFHELHAEGEANAEGVKLVGLMKVTTQGTINYRPQIVNGSQLVGFDPITSTTISGPQLTNAYLSVATRDGDHYKIVIKKVSSLASTNVKFWVGPATPIETYELVYSQGSSADPLPLCNTPPERISGEDNSRVWGRPLEAILYTGDRYDAERKRVTASSYRDAGTWFNIACAGSALAKLHLTRHTTAGTTTGFVSKADQRQAMLKMYVSDLCGTGASFTKKGTPLHWQNTSVPAWSKLDGNEFAHEAMWSEDGALCLDTHRRFDEYVPDIKTECAAVGRDLSPCSGTPLLAGSYYLTTAVPFATIP